MYLFATFWTTDQQGKTFSVSSDIEQASLVRHDFLFLNITFQLGSMRRHFSSGTSLQRTRLWSAINPSLADPACVGLCHSQVVLEEIPLLMQSTKKKIKKQRNEDTVRSFWNYL